MADLLGLGACNGCVHGRERWRGIMLCSRKRRKPAFLERSTLLWLMTGLRSCGPFARRCTPDPARVSSARFGSRLHGHAVLYVDDKPVIIRAASISVGETVQIGRHRFSLRPKK